MITINYRSRWGQVDIVAQEGSEVVFVDSQHAPGDGVGHSGGISNCDKGEAFNRDCARLPAGK